MLATAPRFTPAAAYRCGILDGRHCAETGDWPALAKLFRLLRPAWLRQDERVVLAYKWGWEAGYAATSAARPDLVA